MSYPPKPSRVQVVECRPGTPMTWQQHHFLQPVMIQWAFGPKGVSSAGLPQLLVSGIWDAVTPGSLHHKSPQVEQEISQFVWDNHRFKAAHPYWQQIREPHGHCVPRT